MASARCRGGVLEPASRAKPEDDLLLQVQGIVAEYERAKIMERSRRGKKHAAQSGSLNVMSGAPFGYRYVPVREGGGQWRLNPLLNRRELSSRSSLGLVATAVVLPKSAVDFTRPVHQRLRVSPSGPVRPCGTFFRILLIWDRRHMERHTKRHCRSGDHSFGLVVVLPHNSDTYCSARTCTARWTCCRGKFQNVP